MRSSYLLLAAILALPAAAQGAASVSWVQEAKLLSSNPAASNGFGRSVAVSGDTILVGEPSTLTASGAAHVFVRDATGWSHQAELVAADAGEFQFGWAVALDGDTALIGTRSDAAYLFQRSGSSWTQTKKLVAHDTTFPPVNGFGVAVDLEADLALCGAPEDSPPTGFASGSVYVYERSGTTWALQSKFFPAALADNDQFGAAVSLSGNAALVGDPFADDLGDVSGCAYVFQRDGTSWNEFAKLLASDGQSGDLFGLHVALWGDTAAVAAPDNVLAPGAPGGSGVSPAEGAVYLFERDLGGPGQWGEALRITSSDPEAGEAFGAAVALEGDRLLVGVPSDRGVDVAGVRGLAFDPVTGTLYGSDTASGQLVTFDTATGMATPVGPLGFADVEGLAFDPGTGTLYGVEEALAQLLVIDTGSGAATAVGPLGFAEVEALAFDTSTGTLLAGDSDTDQLLAIDTSTGAATPVGPFAFAFPDQNVTGLAFDAGTGTLFGTRGPKSPGTSHRLITVKTTNGKGTIVGDTGKLDVLGLAFAPGSGLFGSRDPGDELLSLDAATGAATGIGVYYTFQDAVGTVFVYERDQGGPGAWGQVAALTAPDGEEGDGYGVDAVALQGPTVVVSAAGDDDGATDAGAAYALDLSASATSYCTAGTSASGCRASLSATGTPSATASSGFTIAAAGVEGSKDGLFFFGVNGRQAVPWGNGSSFQCVQPPVSRGGLLVGSGTPGVCDGAFAQDLNAHWCPTCPKPNHDPGAGAVVQAQLWYRDPQNTSNQTTSLSDAVEFAVGP